MTNGHAPYKHGGRRPGAGGKHTNLNRVVSTRRVRGPNGQEIEQQLTILDVIVETIRAGAFLHDAAARAGINVATLRDWRRLGVQINAQILNGERKRSTLQDWERQRLDLAMKMELAEAEARTALLGIIRRAAQGGIETTTVTEKVWPGMAPGSQARVMERTTVVTHTLPDVKAAMWLLSHRWPGDFAGRVEISGPDGAPISLAAEGPLERLRSQLGVIQANVTSGAPTGDTGGNGAMPALPPAPTNGHNPEENDASPN